MEQGGVQNDDAQLLYDLKQIRKNIRSKFTRFVNFLNDETNQQDDTQLELRISKIEGLLAEFEEVQNKIYVLTNDDNGSKEIEDFQNLYYHEISRAPDIQKLSYLRSCLKGEAAKIISALETSSANYQVAWDLLKSRYANRRVLIQNHIKNLLELPNIVKESASSIRSLLNNVQTHLLALKALGESVDQWDSLLIYLITSKLDRYTHREWETTITGTTMPKMSSFIEFLQKRHQILESTTFDNVVKTQGSHTHANHNVANKKQSLLTTRSKDFCNYCKSEHKIYGCEMFQALSIEERDNAVKSAGICFNCLRKGHQSKDCNLSKCRKCNKRHHTFLHPDSQTNENSQTNLMTKGLHVASPSQVVLSTALVDFVAKNGKKVQARVVLDSGSQSHFITKKIASLLQIDYNNLKISVEGLSKIETRIKHSICAQIKSKCSEFNTRLDFLIIPQICNALPLEVINRKNLSIPNNIQLADPEFHKPAKIDALLGAEIFYDLLSIGQIRLPKGIALLQKTKLGWILAGKIGRQDSSVKNGNCFLSVESLQQQMSRFWEIEEISDQIYLSEEETAVENHFKNNVDRDSNGKYIVKLPFNEKKDKLGMSHSLAEKRFFALEKKFNQNVDLKKEYVKFMPEYKDLGHMSQVSRDTLQPGGYFLPHHAVVKNSSTTTKVRVVFDGSAKTTSGLSLNDTLRVGPTIQQNLFDIVIRARKHEIILVADIEKMYRIVKIHKDDAKYQRILWRENSNDKLEVFELNTVTYGTASAPYLATRTLHQLAEDEGEHFPEASKVLKRDFYVDDLYTGAKTRLEAQILRDQLNQLLLRGGFNLRKWCSNDYELITSLPDKIANVQLFTDSS